MARGSERSFYKRFYANVKSKKNSEPYFDIQRSEPADYVIQPGELRSETNAKMVKSKEKNLSGYLVKAEITQGEFEGHTIDSLEVTLRDHGVQEDYVIKAGIGTMMGRNILNSLLNIENFGFIEMSLYVNKEGFNSVSVKNDREWAGFKIPFEEYKALVRTYIGKGDKEEKDYTKVDDFFKKQFNLVLLPKLKEYLATADIDVKVSDKPKVKEEEPVIDHLSAIREEKTNRPTPTSSSKELNDLPFDKDGNYKEDVPQVNPKADIDAELF